MRIAVDREKCSGLGICEGLAPDLFEVDEDGKARVLVDSINERSLRDAEDAVIGCPMMALKLLKSS